MRSSREAIGLVHIDFHLLLAIVAKHHGASVVVVSRQTRRNYTYVVFKCRLSAETLRVKLSPVDFIESTAEPVTQ